MPEPARARPTKGEYRTADADYYLCADDRGPSGSGPRASEDGALHDASRHGAGEQRDTPWTGAGRGLG